MADRLNWGLIGTGGIAREMLAAVRQVGSSVTAVGSRSAERAQAFAAEHELSGTAGTVADLIAAEPDVVYVGSSNHNHLGDALACIDAGIPVLCEKPLTPNGADSRVMVQRATDSGVFLMEAMWMRFQPAWQTLTSAIESGVIGRVTSIQADFGMVANPDPARRWFDPAQAGGSILDVGIYPITFAYLLAGAPTDVAALHTHVQSGVDAQFGIVLKHRDDVMSVLSSSMVSDSTLAATVSGPKGRLHLRSPFHHPSAIEHWVGGDLIESWDTSYEGSGYVFEVAEVERCLALGLTESSIHPLSDTLAVLDIIDKARAV